MQSSTTPMMSAGDLLSIAATIVGCHVPEDSDMTVFRNSTFLASVIALGSVGAVQARDVGPRLVGGGENTQVVYAEPSRNVVGGGHATISGGADNLRITYGPRATAQAAIGRVAELVGGGDNAQVVYHQTAPSGSMVAGAAGWPHGGPR
jgi:hypothetical protein